ncbi:Ig-like domain repeat protein, partial [Oscillibacter sp.]|uniref:Ig-like domain repeat protein n=1 Tax=Oscillibacter sp. TaxID=1945593 RepID=UPI003398E796
MKKKGKQFFSLLLSAVIVLTLLPTITLKASAADAPSIAEKYSNFAYHFPHATGVAVDSDNHVYVSDDRGLEEQGSVYYYKEVAQSSCIKYYNNYLYVGDYINSRIAASCTIISSSTDNNNIPFHSWSKPDYTGDLAFDSSSDIFFVEGNTLYRKSVDSSGMVVNTTDHFSYPGEFSDYDGLAADNARNVYVADYSNSVIEKFDFSGDCSVIANVRARHLVLDSNGNLYANGDGKLYRIDTLGNVVTILSSGVSNNGMCFYNDTKDKNANNSHILIANSATNAVDEATFPTPTSSTTLSVSVNKSSIVSGSSATLTATGLQPAATGTVTFKSSGGTVLGTAQVSGGTASCDTATTLPIGNYNDITAVYSGDVNYLGTSSTLASTFIVTGTTPTALTASVRDSSVMYGTPVSLMSSGLPTAATGTVTFTNSDGTVLGTAAVSNGAANCVTKSNLAVGTYNVTAAYCGDSTYEPSNATTSFTVTSAVTTITLFENIPSAASDSSGSVTFTVEGIQSNATATVEFSATNGAQTVSLTSGTLSSGVTSGQFTVPISSFKAICGDYTVTATASYHGSSSYASSSATVHFAITGSGDPSFTVPSSASFNLNDPVVLTASTGHTDATGTVTFTDYAGNLIGSAPLSGGKAQCTLNSGTFPTGSTNTIYVVYYGDSTYEGATESYTVTITSLYSAGFSVSSTTNPFVVRADNFPSDATGSVSFKLKSGNYSQTATGVQISNGSAVFAVTRNFNGMSDGTCIITATYSPDTTAKSKYASTSQTANMTIVKAAPQFTSADNADFTVGSPGTFTVSTANYPLAALTETGTLPTGVTFTDNKNGTATIAGIPTTKGSSTFTITAANGTSPDATQQFTLTVQPDNSMVSPGIASFDKNIGSTGYADIPVTLALNGNTFSGIYIGETQVDSANYTVSADGKTVTLKKEYLAGLSTGDTALTFRFNGGNDATLTVTVSGAFVAVTSITGVPTTATAGTDLTLSGTVNPATATNQTITWTLKSAGTTGATVTNGVLSTTAAGTATVTATVANGTTSSTDYTQDFDITVSAATPAFVAVTGITGVPTTATAGTDLTLSGTVNP